MSMAIPEASPGFKFPETEIDRNDRVVVPVGEGSLGVPLDYQTIPSAYGESGGDWPFVYLELYMTAPGDVPIQGLMPGETIEEYETRMFGHLLTADELAEALRLSGDFDTGSDNEDWRAEFFKGERALVELRRQAEAQAMAAEAISDNT